MRTAYLVALVTIVLAIFPLRAVTHENTIPTREPLNVFPLKMEGWEGQTQFLEPGILQTLQVDDYLLRRYRASPGNELWLYVGYWGSQRPGVNRLHSPIVCLPGAGWSIASLQNMPIRLADRTIIVNHAEVQKGEARQVVLYWYQIKGTVVAKELSAVTFMAWTSLTQHRDDEALVRITASAFGPSQDTLQNEAAFLQAAFPHLDRLLPR
ncbi:MAG: EpsI family protein [Bacillati bacterium ANGP1]|uniref:EpsI family protein n=1 Tax=Candidatus Segetimicrobium genomatis TaxID=2569760 RepID=A0A537J3W4_9BACT|nr:MAG: EpsI family protein [Terrabacteria group bacterium ANGP1]